MGTGLRAISRNFAAVFLSDPPFVGFVGFMSVSCRFHVGFMSARNGRRVHQGTFDERK